MGTYVVMEISHVVREILVVVKETSEVVKENTLEAWEILEEEKEIWVVVTAASEEM